jgi:hypothetical protein
MNTMTSIQVRVEAVSAAVRAAKDGGATAWVNLPYKAGTGGPFPVVDLDLNNVVYNHRSHRIRAQLESHPESERVASDPQSEVSQEAIRGILEETEGFQDLANNVAEQGQREHGVVTREGLLVDGNTRLAALRSLGGGPRYIKVAVLPEDADEVAIDQLECALQVRRDFKQDYTYTNHLLFIDELLRAEDQESVAKTLNLAASSDAKELERGVKAVREATGQLALIRQIQELSAGSVMLTFFDSQQAALRELYIEYQKQLDEGDIAAADRTKMARFLGILCPSARYRDLREIDAGTAEEYLVASLKDEDVLRGELDALIATPVVQPDVPNEERPDDQTDILSPPEQTKDLGAEGPADLTLLVELVGKSYGQESVRMPSGSTLGRDDLLDAVADAIEITADDVRADLRALKNAEGPATQLGDAVKKCRAAIDGYRKFATDPSFNKGKFEFQIKKLRKQVEGLENAVKEAGA